MKKKRSFGKRDEKKSIAQGSVAPKPKKHLGQHFLTSKSILNKVVTACVHDKSETILEVGPGRGDLTSALLEAGYKVFAIEKDRDLIALLDLKFAKELRNGKLTLVCDDALIMNDFFLKKHRLKKYSVVANIPYYITGMLIEKFVTLSPLPTSITLLVQKEVAERVIARDKRESILSLSVKWFGIPRIAGIVKAGSFNPPPKVDSAILTISNISPRKAKDTEKFFSLVKAGFSHKRKNLLKNLSGFFKRDELVEIFTKLKKTETVRAENLSLSDWETLVNEVG